MPVKVGGALVGNFVGNRALLRAQLSFGAAFTAEWSFSVAIGLVAFAHGGALAVGLVGLIRLAPAALLAPVISVYADRVPRERVLFASSAVRGLATLAAALVLAADGPVLVVYTLAVASTIAFTPYRASHSALVPTLCRSPDELTSVNVVRGALDSISVILGPLVAALLLAVWSISAVFVFAGVCALISAGLVMRLNYENLPLAPTRRRHIWAEIHDGLAAAGSNAGVRVVVGFVVLQAAIRGAFGVFVVVVAIKMLHGDQSSVGLLQGAVGVGALLGSISCALLIGSRAMARWLGVAIVLWGAPIALIGLLPNHVVALFAAAVIGVGNALVDVTAFTLIARMVPNVVLARVFGVLESVGALAVGVGFIAAPGLIGLLGTKGALLTVGAVARRLPPVVAAAYHDRRLGSSSNRRHHVAAPSTDAATIAGAHHRAARSWPPTHQAAPGRGGVRSWRRWRQVLCRRCRDRERVGRRSIGTHDGPRSGLRRNRTPR